jgi:hypothetical protein
MLENAAIRLKELGMGLVSFRNDKGGRGEAAPGRTKVRCGMPQSP